MTQSKSLFDSNYEAMFSNRYFLKGDQIIDARKGTPVSAGKNGLVRLYYGPRQSEVFNLKYAKMMVENFNETEEEKLDNDLIEVSQKVPLYDRYVIRNGSIWNLRTDKKVVPRNGKVRIYGHNDNPRSYQSVSFEQAKENISLSYFKFKVNWRTEEVVEPETHKSTTELEQLFREAQAMLDREESKEEIVFDTDSNLTVDIHESDDETDADESDFEDEHKVAVPDLSHATEELERLMDSPVCEQPLLGEVMSHESEPENFDAEYNTMFEELVSDPLEQEHSPTPVVKERETVEVVESSCILDHMRIQYGNLDNDIAPVEADEHKFEYFDEPIEDLDRQNLVKFVLEPAAMRMIFRTAYRCSSLKTKLGLLTVQDEEKSPEFETTMNGIVKCSRAFAKVCDDVTGKVHSTLKAATMTLLAALWYHGGKAIPLRQLRALLRNCAYPTDLTNMDKFPEPHRRNILAEYFIDINGDGCLEIVLFRGIGAFDYYQVGAQFENHVMSTVMDANEYYCEYPFGHALYDMNPRCEIAGWLDEHGAPIAAQCLQIGSYGELLHPLTRNPMFQQPAVLPTHALLRKTANPVVREAIAMRRDLRARYRFIAGWGIYDKGPVIDDDNVEDAFEYFKYNGEGNQQTWGPPDGQGRFLPVRFENCGKLNESLLMTTLEDNDGYQYHIPYAVACAVLCDSNLIIEQYNADVGLAIEIDYLTKVKRDINTCVIVFNHFQDAFYFEQDDHALRLECSSADYSSTCKCIYLEYGPDLGGVIADYVFGAHKKVTHDTWEEESVEPDNIKRPSECVFQRHWDEFKEQCEAMLQRANAILSIAQEVKVFKVTEVSHEGLDDSSYVPSLEKGASVPLGKVPGQSRQLPKSSRKFDIRPALLARAPLDTDDSCSICLGKIHSLETALPCSHGFHHDCIRQWAVRRQNCPECRLELNYQDLEQLDILPNVEDVPVPQQGTVAEGRFTIDHYNWFLDGPDGPEVQTNELFFEDWLRMQRERGHWLVKGKTAHHRVLAELLTVQIGKWQRNVMDRSKLTRTQRMIFRQFMQLVLANVVKRRGMPLGTTNFLSYQFTVAGEDDVFEVEYNDGNCLVKALRYMDRIYMESGRLPTRREVPSEFQYYFREVIALITERYSPEQKVDEDGDLEMRELRRVPIDIAVEDEDVEDDPVLDDLPNSPPPLRRSVGILAGLFESASNAINGVRRFAERQLSWDSDDLDEL